MLTNDLMKHDNWLASSFPCSSDATDVWRSSNSLISWNEIMCWSVSVTTKSHKLMTRFSWNMEVSQVFGQETTDQSGNQVLFFSILPKDDCCFRIWNMIWWLCALQCFCKYQGDGDYSYRGEHHLVPTISPQEDRWTGSSLGNIREGIGWNW